MRKLKHALQDAFAVLCCLIVVAAIIFASYELVRLFAWLP